MPQEIAPAFRPMPAPTDRTCSTEQRQRYREKRGKRGMQNAQEGERKLSRLRCAPSRPLGPSQSCQQPEQPRRRGSSQSHWVVWPWPPPCSSSMAPPFLTVCSMLQISQVQTISSYSVLPVLKVLINVNQEEKKYPGTAVKKKKEKAEVKLCSQRAKYFSWYFSGT